MMMMMKRRRIMKITIINNYIIQNGLTAWALMGRQFLTIRVLPQQPYGQL
jgi:hypothetical protein